MSTKHKQANHLFYKQWLWTVTTDLQLSGSHCSSFQEGKRYRTGKSVAKDRETHWKIKSDVGGGKLSKTDSLKRPELWLPRVSWGSLMHWEAQAPGFPRTFPECQLWQVCARHWNFHFCVSLGWNGDIIKILTIISRELVLQEITNAQLWNKYYNNPQVWLWDDVSPGYPANRNGMNCKS